MGSREFPLSRPTRRSDPPVQDPKPLRRLKVPFVLLPGSSLGPLARILIKSRVVQAGLLRALPVPTPRVGIGIFAL